MRVPGFKFVRDRLIGLRGRTLGGGVILGYHRVADDAADPHVLSIGPEAFAEQVGVLRRHFRPVSLDELVADGGAPGNGDPRRPAAVTFDDGYADVLHRALPILEAAGVPVTVFVVTRCVGAERFPWDEPRGGVEGRPMDPDEFRELAARPGVTVGSHTSSHPDLSRVPASEVRPELEESRAWLQDRVGRPVRHLSYPHGGVNLTIKELAAQAGYQLACASRPGLVTGGADFLELPRLWPPNVGGRAFERWLRSRTGSRPREGAR